ncbi:NTP pyrophosphatase (non-canonical NTP hydrolase) [Bacillus sp. SORGH_AS 510]|uniref:hypothetical protein n=1 Tax=Bacillus sp. SORGH_AS_0510 TaxID=3041771 RepID=UPI002783A2C1|nr:hypothetical protein [Bacillus sp. SORGH_AS_0510]MDQ1144024.1 NTP pyrophosphatase (non-canonical NTP hydrolase) [Bacillus sp. SORGH_AS_0510]
MGNDDYVTKNYYLEKLGFKSRNIKQIESKFSGVKYWDLDTLDKYVFKQIQNINLSINRLMGEAFDLIRKGIFDNVNLYEKLYVVLNDESHHEADELEDLFLLYKKAKNEATENIKAEYGTSLFYATRMKLINNECQELIESVEKYQPLLDNDIAYFYNQYLIHSTISDEVTVENLLTAEYDFEVEDYDGAYHTIDFESKYIEAVENFISNYTASRKQSSLKHIDQLIKIGITGGFYNRGIMIKFADEFFDFMFQDYNQETFDKYYEELIEVAKEAYEEELQEYIDDELSFLPIKAS